MAGSAARPETRGALQRLRRARPELRLFPGAHARVDGVDWYWPAGSTVAVDEPGDDVRLLAPFDPIVWDRRRFEILWGWAYRFEAYTPVPKRKLGYYALPLLWRDHVIGWANVSAAGGSLRSDVGYVASRPPRGPEFRRALEEELHRLRVFLGLRTARNET